MTLPLGRILNRMVTFPFRKSDAWASCRINLSQVACVAFGKRGNSRRHFLILLRASAGRMTSIPKARRASLAEK